MATPNYSYEKRQKELAKKRKKEDKLKRKGEGRPEDGEVGPDGQPLPEAAADSTPGEAPADPAA